MMHGLRCCMAYGMFLDRELNLCSLHWQVDSYPLHPKKSCLFFKSTSFIISLKVGLVVTILSLPSSENVWISPLYLKGIFAGHGVLVQMFLFFIFLISAVEMSATSFWPLWFKMRNPLSF